MSEDIDELLYTQEDVNEWIRACDELQEVLLDKREEIKNIQSQLDQQKAMWNELKEWLKEIKTSSEKQMKEARINTDYYTRASVQNLAVERVLEKMQELEGEDE